MNHSVINLEESTFELLKRPLNVISARSLLEMQSLISRWFLDPGEPY